MSFFSQLQVTDVILHLEHTNKNFKKKLLKIDKQQMQLYGEKTIKYSKYNVLLICINLSSRYFVLMPSQKLCETDVVY